MLPLLTSVYLVIFITEIIGKICQHKLTELFKNSINQYENNIVIKNTEVNQENISLTESHE